MSVNAITAKNVVVGMPSPNPPKKPADSLSGPPDLEVTSGGELGIEGLAAALCIDAAQANAKLMHEMSRAESQEQIDALHHQVDELHEKASAVRAEGWATGVTTAVGGAVTAYGGVGAFDKTTTADAVVKMGQNVGTLGASAAKATAGAAQVDHDADATGAAADAKFREAAKDDYESIARDAKGVVDRVQSTLQAIAQEREATRRAILKT